MGLDTAGPFIIYSFFSFIKHFPSTFCVPGLGKKRCLGHEPCLRQLPGGASDPAEVSPPAGAGGSLEGVLVQL